MAGLELEFNTCEFGLQSLHFNHLLSLAFLAASQIHSFCWRRIELSDFLYLRCFWYGERPWGLLMFSIDPYLVPHTPQSSLPSRYILPPVWLPPTGAPAWNWRSACLPPWLSVFTILQDWIVKLFLLSLGFLYLLVCPPSLLWGRSQLGDSPSLVFV